jgi:hypothetical protein
MRGHAAGGPPSGTAGRPGRVQLLGSPKRLGLLPYFATLLELSPADHVDATLNQGDTGRPGVAEEILADTGLEFVDRGTAQVIDEWPDLDLAARAIRPMYTPGLGVRIISEFGWIMGRVPGG